MPFEFERLSIPEVILIKPKKFGDDRGFFMETFKNSDFEKLGIIGPFRQDNHSLSMEVGVLRGLHYQLNPKPQGKIVRVISGRVFDVVVDIRKNSPTFGKWVSAELSDTNNYMLWVPPGFAHGFLTLEPSTNLLYKCTSEYDANLDRSIFYNDPALNIIWPKNISFILSQKDKEATYLRDAEINFSFLQKEIV
jgi:dTDP-4-dehydrorhamnose 3,5-epimerase